MTSDSGHADVNAQVHGRLSHRRYESPGNGKAGAVTMEPPSKRLKLRQTPYESDEESNPDELSMDPVQFDARQDPMYQLDKGRAKAATRLKSTFESIFEKYERDFTGVGDEIDLRTGEIIIDNGHLESLNDEKDNAREGSVSSGEEERILRGKEARPAKRSHSVSLMPANPSSYNRTQSLQPWKQPAMPGGSASQPSSLSMHPYMLEDPSQFPFNLSMFGNSSVDPAWQVPELPLPYFQNGFGYGYNYQAPGFPQPMPFNRESAMAAGGSYYGHQGGLYRRQGFKKGASAELFPRRSLPTTESKESDTDEDDILLAGDQKGASRPVFRKAGEKSPTSARELQGASSTAHESRNKSHIPSRQSKETSIVTERDERQTGLHKKSSVEKVSRENESTGSPKKRNKAKLLRPGPGRPRKIKSVEKLHKSNTESEPGETAKSTGATIPMSQSKPEIPRRKPGRPKKSTVAEEPGSVQKTTIESSKLGAGTRSSPPTSAAASKLTISSATTISLPVRPSQTSAAQIFPTKNEVTATEPTPFDLQQRRSLRARKQTEFYGALTWRKRDQSPSENVAEEINEESISSQTGDDTLPRLTDPQDTSSTEDTESEQREENAQVIHDEVLSGLQDNTRTMNQQDDGDRIVPEVDIGEKIENDPISSSLLEDRYTENEKDTEFGQDSPALGSSPLEISGRGGGELSLQTTETFSRNELDPLYNYSGGEEDLDRKPADSGTDIQLAPQEKRTSDNGTRVFGNPDISLHRHVAPNDSTINRISVVSEQPEVANSESGRDAGSLDTDRVSNVPENSDEEVQELSDDALSNIQLTPEPDISQQELECQREPGRTRANQDRGATLSPELGTEIASRFSPELGEDNAALQISIEKDSEENPEPELTGRPNLPEARPAAETVAVISNARPSAPVTPKKPKRSDAEKSQTRGHVTSPVRKRFALASLIPDGAGDNDIDDNDDDEIRIISSSHSCTPRSFRAKLSLAARRYSLSSSTPRKLTPSRRSNLPIGTPEGRRTSAVPATDSRALSRAGRSRLGGSGDVQSSPLARAAAQNALLRTPRRSATKGPNANTSPTESLVRTPGGTMRRCGEDGFACERDFCFTCCK